MGMKKTSGDEEEKFEKVERRWWKSSLRQAHKIDPLFHHLHREEWRLYHKIIYIKYEM